MRRGIAFGNAYWLSDVARLQSPTRKPVAACAVWERRNGERLRGATHLGGGESLPGDCEIVRSRGDPRRFVDSATETGGPR